MKLVLSIAISLVLFACSSEQEDAVIKKEAFTEVLTDLIVADAIVGYELGRDMDLKDQMTGHYQKVFDKHGITKEEFESAFNHYSKDLRSMQKIYGEVAVNVSKIRQGINDKHLIQE